MKFCSFCEWWKTRKLRNLGRIHTILSILSHPDMPCYGGVSRALDRLFVDVPLKQGEWAMNQAETIATARLSERKNLVKISPRQYTMDEGINLSKKGVRTTGVLLL